ncbi:MAG: heme biosynthesis HemY N-terminal domain-containing protein, partial [Planktomarina sp.]|nr:heme biosynthesis HemY N-terminal domain-containing protein [Planktomarina sp.]
MLWSLIKILIFLTFVSTIALGAITLMESSGGVIIEYAGFELSFGPLQAAILGLLLMLTLWVLIKVFGLIVAVFRFLNGDETAISRYIDRNRERRGFEALSAGLMAIASGDGSEAMAKARRADKLLKRPNLTNLVIAQAAVVSGDSKTARTTYKKLLQDPKTRFVGVHGLLKQTLISEDMETALKLAERAFALKPKHEETQDV